jgi:hypothetical protein
MDIGKMIEVTVPAVSGFIVAIISEPIRKRLDLVSLEVTFNASKDVVKTRDNKQLKGIYYYLRVTNTSKRRHAKKVSCYLTSVSKSNDEGLVWKSIFNIPLGMNWSYIDKHFDMDIAPGMHRCINLFAFDKKDNVLRPTTDPKPFFLMDKLEHHGRYRFFFYVTGEGLKIRYKGSIDINWKGKWNDCVPDNFSVQPVKTPFLWG